MMYRILIFIGFVIFSWMPSVEGTEQEDSVNTLQVTGYRLQVTGSSLPNLQPATGFLQPANGLFSRDPNNPKDRHRDWKLYTALGISLASATAALLTERAANHAYDNYLISAGPARQERYYRQTVRYDRASGMLWGLFELGFVATWYLTFF